jgi:signal peptidase I
VAAVALLLSARALIAEPFRVSSGSMEPTLSDGDRVLVAKLRRTRPRRGDLVAFQEPGSNGVLLKRVVALAGDRVAIEDGRLVVNDRPQREPYADPDEIDSVYFGPVDVPVRTVFVLGDNRSNSVDSRQFGAIRESALIGEVQARVWPPAGWGAPG